VTKQSETRDQVLELIEQLGVGEAIPSERQLSTDLGVSRLTVRAALDDLVREGYLIRRRGSGTFVSEPKIAQELTMTSFTEDMRRRGMQPGSKTLALEAVAAVLIVGGGAGALRVLMQVRDPARARRTMSQMLLLALDFTIGADILKGASSPPDLASVEVVAIVALIRVLLTFALQREIAERVEAASAPH
jgi:uncharacterized membrane protein/biotin operon repressor